MLVAQNIETHGSREWIRNCLKMGEEGEGKGLLKATGFLLEVTKIV
jgi:hypothetical protein